MLAFTAVDNSRVEVRHLEVSDIAPQRATTGELPMREIGPSFDLVFRRKYFAADEVWKEATKRPKAKTATLNKKRNIYTDPLGEQKAKVFVNKQNLDKLSLRKIKRNKAAPEADGPAADI